MAHAGGPREGPVPFHVPVFAAVAENPFLARARAEKNGSATAAKTG